MTHEIICDWLQLPDKAWPPDHYTLLGLPPGEADTERTEQQVHQRLEIVRRYQLTHPEQATAAMNQLAQAFVCLTDPAAKKAYDAGILGGPPALPEPAAGAEAEETGAVVALEAAPAEPAPAGPRPAARTDLPVAAVMTAPAPPTPAPAPEVVVERAEAVLAAAPAPPPVDPVAESARSAPAARRGLGTKRALYRRLALTRRLARSWELAGKYLAWPKRRLTRLAESTELSLLLTAVREGLRGFPPVLGEAGQPGYLVLSLAKQPAVVPTFQTLRSSQREALARDWWAGRTFLQSHREFLRQELRTLRKKSIWYRGARAARSFLSEHPGGLLVLLALLALNVALWRSLVASDWWPTLFSSRPASSERSVP